METENSRNKLIAGVAVAALVLGGGGIMLGRTMFAPTPTAVAEEEHAGEEKEEEGPCRRPNPHGGVSRKSCWYRYRSVAIGRIGCRDIGARCRRLDTRRRSSANRTCGWGRCPH